MGKEERPLKPSQVADLFSVSVTTVGKWADAGLLPHFRTPGGKRRFRRADVEALVKVRPATNGDEAA